MANDERGGILIPATIRGNTIQDHAMLGGIGTVSVDPANQTGAAFFNTDITLTGVKVGDLVCMFAPYDLEDTLRLVGAGVQAANTVRIKLEATAAVNGAAKDWTYIWFRVAG